MRLRRGAKPCSPTAWFKRTSAIRPQGARCGSALPSGPDRKMIGSSIHIASGTPLRLPGTYLHPLAASIDALSNRSRPLDDLSSTFWGLPSTPTRTLRIVRAGPATAVAALGAVALSATCSGASVLTVDPGTDGDAANGTAGTAVHPINVQAITVSTKVACRELPMLKRGPKGREHDGSVWHPDGGCGRSRCGGWAVLVAMVVTMVENNTMYIMLNRRR